MRLARPLVPLALLTSPRCVHQDHRAAGPAPAATGCRRTGRRSRDVTEWDEFTGRLGPSIPWTSGRACPASCPPSTSREGAPGLTGRPALPRSIRGRFQTEVDRLRAELTRSRATVERAGSELQRAERLRARTPSPGEERDRRAVGRAGVAGQQVAAVGAALRAAELNLEFTQVTSPINGTHRPRHRHRGQPGIERARRGHAAHDRGLSSIRSTRRSTLTSRRSSRYERCAGRHAAATSSVATGSHGARRGRSGFPT